MPKPRSLLGAQHPAFLGDGSVVENYRPGPSRWDRVKQALWDTNLNAPIRGAYNLMNTPLETLLGYGSEAEQEAAVANSFDAASGLAITSSVVPKPQNSINMGIRLWHGSPKAGLNKLKPSVEGRGALGPGVYGTPAQNVASRYGGNVYSFDAPDQMFLGSGKQWDDIPSSVNYFQLWRDQVAKLAAANPEHADIITTAGGKAMNDGYPFFRELAFRLGSKEKAQELFKRAGYKGFTAMVDGPEAVLFDSVPLSGGE
jgi:hypothetical protein